MELQLQEMNKCHLYIVKRALVLLILSMAILCPKAHAQDTTTAYTLLQSAQDKYYYGDFTNALNEARAARQLIHDFDPPIIKKQVQANMLLARCLVFVEEADTAIYYLDEAETIIQSQENLDTFLLAQVYGLLSHAHDRDSRLSKAMYYGKQCLFWGRKMNPVHPQLGDFYHSLANVYFSMGDYEVSYENYQRAVDYYLLTMPADHPSVLETRMAKSYTQLLNRDIDNAILEINNLIVASGTKEENKTTLMALHSIKGVGLSERGDYEEALVEVDKSLALIYEVFGTENAFAADVLQSKAQLLTYLEQYDVAETIYDESIQKCRASLGDENDLLGAIYTDKAKLFTGLERFDEAAKMYDAALNALNYKDNESVHEVAYFKELLNALGGRINNRIKAYESSGDIAQIQSKEFDQAVELVDKVRSIFTHEGAKQQLVSNFYSIFENAIHAKLIAYEQDADAGLLADAFTIMEKGKVQTLLDQLQQVKGPETGGLPSWMIQERDSLQQELATARQAIFKTEPQQDSSYHRWNTQYLALKEKYEELIVNIKTDYPEYHQFTYRQDAITLEDVREKLLDEETAVLEYFLGEEFLFGILICSDQINYIKKPIDEKLNTRISESINAIVSGNESDEFEYVSNLLYQELIDQLPENVNKLIVIPDGELAYVPFELLNGKADDYLVRNFDISYASSATLLQYQNNISTNPERGFAGFAPDYELDITIEPDTLYDVELATLVRSGNVNLPAAIEEVETIADIMKGETYLNEDASEAQFKANAGAYDILHLAMHSLVNTTNPAFSRLLFDLTPASDEDDGQLLVEELYGMKLQARMAVLSACNTGYGDTKKGEGTLSIARAFAYAGVPSTLMSLWEVPDKSTSYIMVEFYKQLAKGKAKDVALRQAKLAYLNDENIPVTLKKPFYWAGFIATGDMSKIDAGSSSWYWWIGLGVFGMLFIMWYWIRGKIGEQ